uniref:Titin n=1 Tax=Fundulus heteroclitus TaxID=8078 RepID=A0A3Q2Q792_FUNHE
MFKLKPVALKFVKKIQDIVLQEAESIGSSAVFECEVTPNTAITSWMKDGGNLRESPKHKLLSDGKDRKLHILDVQLSDTGEYTCVAKNAGKEISCTLPVKWVKELEPETSCMKGQPMYLTCELNKERDVVWKHNGGLLKKKAGKVAINVIGLQHAITIQNSTDDDAGIYTCEVEGQENIKTSTTVKVIVRVNVLVVVDVSCRDSVTVRAGQIISLITRVKGRPDPEITWTKDARVLSREKRTEFNNNYPVCELIINDAIRSDYGKYGITKNEGGESDWVTTGEVLVKEQLVEPEVKVKLDATLVVRAGDSIAIEATVKGKPQPDVKWTKDERTEEIRKGLRHQLETGVDFSKLLITGARRTDSGQYVVTASNSAGTSSAKGTVNVLDRPGPIRDLKVSDITTDRCNLAWEVPEDDGGCDIYNYIIEKCETKRGVWSVHSNAVITNKAKVTRLIEGNEYIFRVRAENKMGPGPAVQSDAIVAGTQFNVPDAPEAPEVTKISKEEMTVQWSDPEKDGGKPIIGYLLEKREEHAIRWSPVNKDPVPGNRFTVTGLLPLHDYQYRVKAVNEIGVGNASKPSRAITAKDAVGKFLSIMLSVYFYLFTLTNTKSTVTLSWTKPVSDGGAPLIGYVVEMRAQGTAKKGDDGWRRCNVAAQLIVCEFTVTSLDEKLVYEFRVSAQNQVGMSLPCDLEGGEPVDDGRSTVLGYMVEKKESKEMKWTRINRKPITERSLEVTGLTEGVEYEFRVIAVNKAGLGNPSEPSAGTTAQNPISKSQTSLFIITFTLFIIQKSNLQMLSEINHCGSPQLLLDQS